MLVNSLLALISDTSWRTALERKVPQETLLNLEFFLNERSRQGAAILPEVGHWFRAINELPLDDVRVVIIGQDPYHGLGQAQGLSFSVPKGMKIPPSLRNIYKELEDDCQIKNDSGDLSHWVKQGVLLLNATLTVEQGKAGSHQKKGWEIVTDSIISIVNERQNNCVFLLWGSFAEKKVALLDTNKHCVLSAPHPSPLSAYRGWFGCGHFSSVNKHLLSLGQSPINW
jgi:uracil-DNA glycosylase